MTCESLRSFPATFCESNKTMWNERKETTNNRCHLDYGKDWKVTCGMLPTLRVLAARGCNSQDSVCLVPYDVQLDSASHLQMTLLEAYCRETEIKVLRVSRDCLRRYVCPGQTDLSCVLITREDPYFQEAPE